MQQTDVVIIGGGQAGLVMSRSLSARGIDHVVLERGRVGERWHAERWHSMHLLTTAAMSALPGLPHAGVDPGTFMPAGAFASYLAAYAQMIAAPIVTGVEVTAVEPAAGGYAVATTSGSWRSRAVVIATGACNSPFRPPMAQSLPSALVQISPAGYRAPAQLPDGGVLVVGASASGAQLAEEIHASGRPVVLAVGSHTRLPRRYRGGDIYERMEAAGILDDMADEGGNLDAARRQRSPQLVGRPDNRDLDLQVLAGQGIRLAGRLAAIDGTTIWFNDDLAATTQSAHRRMVRILDRVDASLDEGTPPAPEETRAPFIADSDLRTLDLRRAGIRSVVWATGYVRRYPWLKAPVFDSRGEIVHRGGVMACTGLYALGLTYLRRRQSAFINGCGIDAEELAPIVKAYLNLSARRVA